jgi:hypothetical protein
MACWLLLTLKKKGRMRQFVEIKQQWIDIFKDALVL